MKRAAFSLRRMQLGDIPGAMRLSIEEGWNQTEKDWRLFIENPGNVCLLAESNNKVIATTTAINYSNKVAWIAMVLVDKEYRGRGISKALLEDIIEKLKFCESIKLDATAAGQQVYKKLDFSDEYMIARMTNISFGGIPQEDSSAVAEPVQFSDLPEVIAFDGNIFGANRALLIEYLVKAYPTKAWLIKRNNGIEGIALGRNGNRYHHIGPVLTSKVGDAKILIAAALKNLTEQPVLIDVLCDKKEVVEWLCTMGFAEQRKFTRMYMNRNPFPGNLDKQFLICGPEFG